MGSDLTRGQCHHLVLTVLTLCVFALCAPNLFAGQPQAPIGLWDGSIQSRAGEVDFGIELKEQGSAITAVLVNATDRQPFSSATWDGQTLTLRLDYYDGQVVLHYVRRAAHGRRVFAADQQRDGAHSGHACTSRCGPGDEAVDWPRPRRRLDFARGRRRGCGEKYPCHSSATRRWPLPMAGLRRRESWNR